MWRDREKNWEMLLLVIMDNFSGQVTDAILTCHEENNIVVCFLPPNTTDFLQPMDIAVNKLTKDLLSASSSIGMHKATEWS